MSALKTLITIPEHFNLRDLYDSKQQESQDYVIRGMICYSDGGHYLGFFRRILIKVEHLVSASMQDINSEVRNLKKTLTQPTEWIQYNDSELKYVPKNWPGVIESCIEGNFYPKVLFYEKLHDPEFDV